MMASNEPGRFPEEIAKMTLDATEAMRKEAVWPNRDLRTLKWKEGAYFYQPVRSAVHQTQAAFHVDSLGGFIPSPMPGRLTVEPLGFSSLFLRPVNFHKAFNVRTSRLIYRAGAPGSQKAFCNTAVFWHRSQRPPSQWFQGLGCGHIF
ncbi:uncharacterized protein RBU33_012455 isoform 1-T1 [Hipposideros larvatus]